MSHYTVMVCLPGHVEDIGAALDEVLAPFDENKSVEPYRSYEDGSAEEFWWTRSMRRDLEGFRAAEKLGDPERFKADLLAKFAAEANTWDSKSPDDKVRAELLDYVWAGERANRIDESPMTWPTLVALYNERWHPAGALAVPGEESDDDEERLYVEDETGRAYKMSTYNPDSKWDYWRIGGRWSGYFVADEALVDIISPKKHWDGPTWEQYPGRTVCDGGRKRSLDFAAMRDFAADAANERYDTYERLVTEHGATGKPWSHFTGLVDVVDGYTIERARRQYHDQPIVAAHERLSNDKKIVGWGDCLIEEFLPPREEYVQQARNAAVPAYALVTLTGEWVAPGRMGWFGMSSDGAGEREGYRGAVSKYLDELKPDTWLVVVDCHI